MQMICLPDRHPRLIFATCPCRRWFHRGREFRLGLLRGPRSPLAGPASDPISSSVEGRISALRNFLICSSALLFSSSELDARRHRERSSNNHACAKKRRSPGNDILIRPDADAASFGTEIAGHLQLL